LGANAVATGDFAAATAYFEEAGRLYQELNIQGDLAYVHAGLGDIAFYTGDYSAARAHYHDALALFREAGNQRLIGRSLGRLGRSACREGDLTTAASLSAEALRVRLAIGHKAGIIFALDEEYVELALAAGQPTVAARLLGAVETARRALQRPRSPVEARHVEPIIAGLQKQLGPVWTAAWAEGEAMSLEQAAAYALDILSPAVVAEPRPEVRILAFGPARIYRGDRLLTSADWTYAKARELVLYLLCHPNASREQVGLAFWPDASAEQVRKRFSAALAHARNALGRDAEWIILNDGRYRIDPARAYWFDVAVFEARLRSAHRLLQNGEPGEQTIPLLEEAIELYQGDFAEDLLEGEWHHVYRASLLQSYLEALLALGGLHTRAGRYEQAIAAYRRALAKDPYLEEAHHELIGCYARLNKRSQALRQYDTLTAALAELNATPSPETQRLVERLRRGEPF
ncbi:MAG TPA: BTAD domain-containing putative transcriptional regulator, partial [Caldilineaceae bacterium]|nr:BTAD domain-containing putative transcriptional regulator [Caldilineaceae bacterium]